MNFKEGKSEKILLVILLVALVALGIYKLFFSKNKELEQIDTETISIVVEPNDFYTVSSCASKYLSYLSISDTEKLIILLSEEYKRKNSITNDNLYSFTGALNGTFSFNARKMFVQRLDSNIYKYYVYGLISEETISLDLNETDYYLVVILDRKNGTFAIEPYDGEIFK